MNRLSISLLVIMATFYLSGSSQASDTTSLNPKELLGKHLFFDAKLSVPEGQSCASCHAPEVGFTGPGEEINKAGGYTRSDKGPFRQPETAHVVLRRGQPGPPLRQEGEGLAGRHVLGRQSHGKQVEGSPRGAGAGALSQSARAEYSRHRNSLHKDQRVNLFFPLRTGMGKGIA